MRSAAQELNKSAWGTRSQRAAAPVLLLSLVACQTQLKRLSALLQLVFEKQAADSELNRDSAVTSTQEVHTPLELALCTKCLQKLG